MSIWLKLTFRRKPTVMIKKFKTLLWPNKALFLQDEKNRGIGKESKCGVCSLVYLEGTVQQLCRK